MKLSDLLPMVPPALVALMSLVEVSPVKIDPYFLGEQPEEVHA